jgi:opacity protein-like surface antigen
VYFGGGAGYRFTPLFRGDVTIDDLPSLRVSGTTTQPGNPSGSAAVSSLVVMANAYVDLNGLDPSLFGAWQPYVTAGLGMVRNDLGQFSGVLSTSTALPVFPAGTPVSENGATETNFAWGAGAGVGYPVTSQLTVELGYKFLSLGELRSGPIGMEGGFVALGTASKSTDLDVHTVILSLRYGF